MPITDGQGHSTYTRLKEEGLDRILALHLNICRNIYDRHDWADPIYRYFDINAGRGENPEEDCPGSPLVFLQATKRVHMPYRAAFIEQEAILCEYLRKVVAVNDWCSGATVHEGDHADVLPALTKSVSKACYGMLYTDPNGMPPFSLLADVFGHPNMHRIDLLIHASGTTIKRVRQFTDKTLQEEITAIDKAYWIVRDHANTGQFQWTFLLGTNWDAFPSYQGAGFYRTDSDQGAAIINELTYTAKERQERVQQALFLPHVQ